MPLRNINLPTVLHEGAGATYSGTTAKVPAIVAHHSYIYSYVVAVFSGGYN